MISNGDENDRFRSNLLYRETLAEAVLIKGNTLPNFI